MERLAKTPASAIHGKRRTRRLGWFFLFFAAAALLYFHFIRVKNHTYTEMTAQLRSLEKERAEALKVHSDLLLQIQSQSDPAWVEMVLKRNLGMVREGQVKVYFHTDS